MQKLQIKRSQLLKSKKDQEEKLHGEQSDELASQDWMKTGKEMGILDMLR